MKEFTDWLVEILLYVPKKTWEWFVDSVAGAVESIPVPPWLTDASGAMNGIPSGVIWFANMVELPTGVAIVLSAYGLRFLIRRIPLIG